jgi:hypothetical protein
MRAPRSVSASDAFDASLISPPPVKPDRERTATARCRDSVPASAFAAPLEAGALDRVAQHLQRAAVAPEPLPGRRGVAGPQRVDLAHAHRIEAERRGDAVHVHFDGELRLRRAEAAERAVGGVLVIVARPRMRM